MALDPPRTLSPSKVTAFTNCPLAFRFSQIEHRPEPPSPPSVKGTLVHAALEGLFWHHRAGDRTQAAAAAELERAWAILQDDDEFVQLELDPDAADAFLAEARALVDNYFRLEDPNEAHAVGVELGVETTVDGMRLRGIIDRLDVAPDGSLIVVDYKTGRAPSERFERGSLGGVQTYALLCESVLGRAPAEVRLLYLRQPIAISSVASEQTIRGQRRRTLAVWSAIEKACDAEDFRPHVGPLCDYCNFKASCPAFAAA
jgi:putative RecB family exonuclease